VLSVINVSNEQHTGSVLLLSYGSRSSACVLQGMASVLRLFCGLLQHKSSLKAAVTLSLGVQGRCIVVSEASNCPVMVLLVGAQHVMGLGLSCGKQEVACSH
jgi:hypothetical protein